MKGAVELIKTGQALGLDIMLTASTLMEDYNDLPDEERLDMISDLVDQAERSRKIVRNLLDFTRESEIKTELLKIEDLIEETVQLASNQIKIAKVRIEKSFAPNLPPVYGDRRQLNQVFLNLVLNALNAMPRDGTLTISSNNTKDRGFAALEVTDTGVGIPEHVLRNIFDPFFTTKPDSRGTGLGLSVSLGIIRQHGGDIHVKSQVNKGTTFTVLLPVVKVPAKISNEQ